MIDTLQFNDFEEAGKAVLKFLHQRMGFDLWMLTRTEGEDWIVLQTEDHGYNVEPGTVFRWADSFCSQMVQGKGPRIAPESERVPAYAAAPIGKKVDIKAYVGQPLTREDGSLFGTLCAIDPRVQPEAIGKEQDLVEMFGALLSTILQMEMKATEEARRAEKLQAEAMTDSLTGIYNRRGWDTLLANEDDRCRRHGNPAAVMSIDLNGLKKVNDNQGHTAGDDLIKRAGEALRKAARAADVVARLGGDEFGILCIECDKQGGETMLDRVRSALGGANVQASVGLAMRDPKTGFKGSWDKADESMYAEKRDSGTAR